MSTASGDADRVAVGVRTSTWTTHGLRRDPKPPSRIPDSYLERYQKIIMKKKNKTDLLQGKQDDTDPRSDENDGTKEANTEKKESREDQASGKTSSEERSKKSRLCVIL